MNCSLILASLSACLLAGCAATRSAAPAPQPQVRLVPDERLYGRIATVNEPGQFVVVDFNVGGQPPLETKMNVYRADTVVGVIRLSGPVQENLVAADIIEGEAAVGDRAIWDRGETRAPVAKPR